jgi:hypothetical protein
MRTLREQLDDNPDMSQIESDKLSQLFCSLREFAHHKGLAAEYDTAQKALTLSDAVCQEFTRRHPREPPDPASLAAESQAFEDHWREKMATFDQDSESRLAAMKDQQQKDFDDFEKLWSSDMPRRYRKASVRLLQLKRVERALARECEFERAKLIHGEAEAMGAHEQALQQENLTRDYHAARSRLIVKQQEDYENLVHTRAHERRILVQQYEREKIAPTNRAFVVEVKKKEIDKGYRTVNKTKVAIGTNSGYSIAGDKSGAEDVLLDPLIPPNDPDYVANDKRSRSEAAKKKAEFQKQNADHTLAKFTVRGEHDLLEKQEGEQAEAGEQGAETGTDSKPPDPDSEPPKQGASPQKPPEKKAKITTAASMAPGSEPPRSVPARSQSTDTVLLVDPISAPIKQ